MKKLLFAAVTLDVGGIETALVTLLNYLAEEKENDEYKYEITLVLEKKQGLFLDDINKRVNIIEYTPNNSIFMPLRKTINLFKQIFFKVKYKNKFDFSCAYATYSNPAAFVARTVSTNSVLWCHMDYLAQYKGNKEKVKEFFKEKHIEDFKNIVFVSEKSKNTFLEVFPNLKENTLHIDNLINYKSIVEKSKENIEEKSLLNKEKRETIFINVSRHDEEQKKISRIIEATKMLAKENLKFKVLLVGDGQDTEKYKVMVNDYSLNEKIFFLGRKKNPYPYINLADCVLLTSEYEGSPVVFTETMILDKPIITTDVAGSEQIVGKFGIIAKKDTSDIYLKMKDFIENGYQLKEKFNPEKYNKNILEHLEKLL